MVPVVTAIYFHNQENYHWNRIGRKRGDDHTANRNTYQPCGLEAPARCSRAEWNESFFPQKERFKKAFTLFWSLLIIIHSFSLNCLQMKTVNVIHHSLNVYVTLPKHRWMRGCHYECVVSPSVSARQS